MAEDKKSTLDGLIGEVEKKYGKGAVMTGGKRLEVPVLASTGSLKLDIALGIGGLPRGRIVEILGGESSGKTTLLIHVMREVQRNGGVCAFIDAEHAFDPVWATNIGLNVNNLLLSQPSCGEEALDIAEMYIKSGLVDFIGIDSVSALVPRVELEGEIGDVHMGVQARLMSQACRKMTGIISNSKCVVAFINQIRYKIGMVWGNPETTSGGNALKFYSSVRIDTRRKTVDKAGEEEMSGAKAVDIQVKIIKNKVAPPFKVTTLTIDTGMEGTYGFNKYKEILDLGVQYKYIKKSGTWYSYGEERIGQGVVKSSEWLANHLEIANDISKKIIDVIQEKDAPEVGSFDSVVQQDMKEEEKSKEEKKVEEKIEELKKEKPKRRRKE